MNGRLPFDDTDAELRIDLTGRRLRCGLKACGPEAVKIADLSDPAIERLLLDAEIAGVAFRGIEE